ncbi:MAG: UPF0182 family protein [Actinobacteria bacterium]|nr:MAG: UPF0182 family protein [Actinomycetota bacterium]REK33149.1 MAG: UPF0182 family protein [Actinomycetota bacterium]
MFTRAPSDVPAPDRRRPFTLIIGIVAAVYLAFTAAGSLWTDYLWFDSIDYEAIWLKNWGVSILLGAIGVLVAFVVIWFSLRLADRLSPRWVPFDLTEEEELIERFREWVEPRIRQIRLLVSVGLAFLLGLAASAWREEFFLWQNGGDFGVEDPVFGADIGFYMFQLPFLETTLDWVFNLFLLALVVVVVVHYFNGGVRLSGRGLNVTSGTKTHILVMLAILALLRAVMYRLDMYALLFSSRSEPSFFGPGYTDVTARLPALRLLIAVAVVAAVIFIVNIWRRGWTLSIVTVVSWLVVAVAAGTIYPAIIQRFQVTPNELGRNREYIANNLEFTRAAYGLDDVEVRDFAASIDLEAEDIEANRLVIDNLRIWDTSVLPRTYQNFQELRPYYALSRVDTDRYLDEGEPTQVMISVRELEEGNLPREDWQNETLFYTHGVGAVVNEANVVEPNGQPRFLLRDVPPVAAQESLELDEPRVYFGETYEPGRPVIVKTGTEAQEVDFPLPGEGTDYNEYQGDAGVVLDNIFKRVAFALRYRDLNLLISGEIRPDSSVLVERNVMAIVDRVAPFLVADADPYPVIMDREILWVIDLYTHSTEYPYSSPLGPAAISRLNRSSEIGLGTNYLRNSVKAVVDAYNGEAKLYLVDPDDPIAAAWDATYPGLLAPMEEMPDGLERHLRYPQDLFNVQSTIYLEYHVQSEGELYTGSDAWALPVDPSTISRDEQGGVNLLNGDRFLTQTNEWDFVDELLPYYVLTNLPGEDVLSYLLLQPFTPLDRRNMSSFLVADSTPGNYGRLVDFRMPQGALVEGTEQVGQRIEQDSEISQQFTLWDSQGSEVIKGDLLVIPIEESLLYIQPIFLEAEGGGIPEFRRIVVVYGDQVEWDDTLDGALGLVFGTEDGQDGDGDGDGDGGEIPDGETVEELIAQAAAAFANADEALAAGDLAGYQRWVEEAQRLIGEIEAILQDAGS